MRLTSTELKPAYRLRLIRGLLLVVGLLATMVVMCLFFISLTGGSGRDSQSSQWQSTEAKSLMRESVGQYRIYEAQGAKLTGVYSTWSLQLNEDESFVMTSAPAEEYSRWAKPGETSLNVNGRWTVEDDGDGSAVAVVNITKVNGRPIQDKMMIRLGSKNILVPVKGSAVRTYVFLKQ